MSLAPVLPSFGFLSQRCLYASAAGASTRMLAMRKSYSTAASAPSKTATGKITLDHGFPILSLSASHFEALKAGRVFSLVPGDTVGNLTASIQKELGAHPPAVSFALEDSGALIAASSDVRVLSKLPVTLTIGAEKLKLDVSQPAKSQQQQTLEKVSPELIAAVKKFYSTVDADKRLDEKREELETQLVALRAELAPLQQTKEKLDEKAARSTNRLAWFGLSAMAFQFGILAQLTWFEYSWDIVEPITYFVTYAAVIAAYSYYVVTKTNYEFTGVRERKWLQFLHRHSKNHGLDINRYNKLKDTAASLEAKLAQIKELQHH